MIIIVLFGAGGIGKLDGELGSDFKAFRKGIQQDEKEEEESE